MGGENNLFGAFRASDAGPVKILGVFDLECSNCIYNAFVNYRSAMVPAGTPQLDRRPPSKHCAKHLRKWLFVGRRIAIAHHKPRRRS